MRKAIALEKRYYSLVLLMRRIAPRNPMIKIAGKAIDGNSGTEVVSSIWQESSLDLFKDLPSSSVA